LNGSTCIIVGRKPVPAAEHRTGLRRRTTKNELQPDQKKHHPAENLERRKLGPDNARKDRVAENGETAEDQRSNKTRPDQDVAKRRLPSFCTTSTRQTITRNGFSSTSSSVVDPKTSVMASAHSLRFS
jgi:hypothetical protein